MNKENFDELLASVKEAGAIQRNEQIASRIFRYSPLNVKKIREKIGLSQTQFSKLIHVSIKTLQNWEQGRREPRGAAVALLMIMKNDPQHAINALH